MDSGKNQPTNSNEPRDWRMPDACSPMVHQLFSETSAERWELSYQTFLAALTRGAAKRFAESTAPIERFQEYFATLHARDLALACACARRFARRLERFCPRISRVPGNGGCSRHEKASGGPGRQGTGRLAVRRALRIDRGPGRPPLVVSLFSRTKLIENLAAGRDCAAPHRFDPGGKEIRFARYQRR